MKLIDRTGHRYGSLVVLEKSSTPRMWRCQCDCGNEALVTGSNLANGSTKSCGCLAAAWARHLGANKNFIQLRSQKALKHGNKRRGQVTPEYKTWLGMKARCYTPSNKDYANWGGRGISVCKQWRHDFEAFLRDMGVKPSPQHTVDRIDSNGNYEPSNCRWATIQQQGQENRRGIVSVVVGGIAYPSIAEACRQLGVKATTVNQRLKAGIALESAFASGRLPARRSKSSYLRKDAR